MGPGVLTKILANLPNVSDPRLLVGFDSSDDACVYRVSDETAVIETVVGVENKDFEKAVKAIYDAFVE